MTYAKVSLEQSLGEIFPFDQLPATALATLTSSSQMLRYRIGQPIIRRESMPYQLIVILAGKGRLLGYEPYQKTPMTLALLQPGSVLGLAGLVRGMPCESAIASSEVTAIAIPINPIRQLMLEQTPFAQAVARQCYLAEVFDLISQYFKTQARNVSDLVTTAQKLTEGGLAATLSKGPMILTQPHPTRLWFVSSPTLNRYPPGSWLTSDKLDGQIVCQQPTRLIGIDMHLLAPLGGTTPGGPLTGPINWPS